MLLLRIRALARFASAVVLVVGGFGTGCGGKTALRIADATRPDGGAPIDAFVPPDAFRPVDAFVQPDAFIAPTDAGPSDAGCIPATDSCGAREICGNGQDDDCNGHVDEGCPCTPGSVQPCFAGPPGRRHIGVCADGAQICGESRTWLECSGGIVPQPDVCNGTDNLCDGCSIHTDCPLRCPSPGDVRVPDGAPFVDYPLHLADFFPMGADRVAMVHWAIAGGPCDSLSPRLHSFDLTGADTPNATFSPKLSGAYTVTLTVTTADGMSVSCSWLVNVLGPGLRVEMCYPESETEDLDLFVHRPGTTTPWLSHTPLGYNPNDDSCGWHDCEARVRGPGVSRVDWGYAPSPLSACQGGPLGPQWVMWGSCTNPRLDIDNNLSEGIGLPENINLDVPREGETFRVMVNNFTGGETHPLVNVYCGGHRIATFGAAPDFVTGFLGGRGAEVMAGAMWRVADVTTHVSGTGDTTCEVEALHPPGSTTGYFVTLTDDFY